MKHQQVSVDYWAMGKGMLTYGLLIAMGWLMMRLFNTVFMLPRRLRNQNENMQQTLAELQKRYPDLNITEEDLKEAEKEFESIINEQNDNKAEEKLNEELTKELENEEQNSAEIPSPTEDKKTI